MGFRLFRKKPVTISAMQWDGTSKGADKIIAAVQQWLTSDEAARTFAFDSGELIIRTLEDGAAGQAKHAASPGDYIIRGVQGEFYACKPDIFDKTYDRGGDVAE